MPISITIVTCTRNPDAAAFPRVLAGVAALETPPGHECEYLIVDSASDPPLASRPGIAAFVAAHPWTRVLRTDVSGLSTARRLALAESRGELLVWFDDDNIPASDYLVRVLATAAAHPEVGVWGAGTIQVEFTEGAPRWVDPAMRPFFQERAHGRDEFGRATAWAPFFPVGSGLATRRRVMERWSDATARGRYTLTGRRGQQLTSGDDAQIIFGAIAAGDAVGVVAAQRLAHLIPARRCTAGYLARLEFALSASLRVARAECFPDDPAVRDFSDLRVRDALRAILAAFRAGRPPGLRGARFEAARRLGALSGALQTTNRPEPWWLRAMIGVLGLR